MLSKKGRHKAPSGLPTLGGTTWQQRSRAREMLVKEAGGTGGDGGAGGDASAN